LKTKVKSTKFNKYSISIKEMAFSDFTRTSIFLSTTVIYHFYLNKHKGELSIGSFKVFLNPF